MILSVTLSKPSGSVEEKLGRAYQKIKIKLVNTADGASYACEMFTKTQVFHQKMSEAELEKFITDNVGTTFKNCVKRTENEEITLLANKKGKVTELRKKISTSSNCGFDTAGACAPAYSTTGDTVSPAQPPEIQLRICGG